MLTSTGGGVEAINRKRLPKPKNRNVVSHLKFVNFLSENNNLIMFVETDCTLKENTVIHGVVLVTSQFVFIIENDRIAFSVLPNEILKIEESVRDKLLVTMVTNDGNYTFRFAGFQQKNQFVLSTRKLSQS